MIHLSKLLKGGRYRGDGVRFGGGARHVPVVVWHLTGCCNLSCAHCYAAGSDSLSCPVMEKEEAFAFIRLLAELNPPALLLSGGEPLLHPLFPEILAYAVQLGLRVSISTNGTLIDDRMATLIGEQSIGYVGVSLDGPRIPNDGFRGLEGAYDRAIAGIERLKKAGTRVGLRFTMAAPQIAYVPDICDISTELGVDRICFYHFVPSGRAFALEGSNSGGGPWAPPKPAGDSVPRPRIAGQEIEKTYLFFQAQPEKINSLSNLLTYNPGVRGTSPPAGFGAEPQGPPSPIRAAASLLPSREETVGALDYIFDWIDRDEAPEEVLTVGNFADGILLYLRLERAGDSRAAAVLDLLKRTGGMKRRGIISVRWDGTVFNDQFSWNRPLGNWRELKEILARENSDEAQVYGGRCGRCNWVGLCKGNMRSRAIALTGDIYGEDPGCPLTGEERASDRL